MATETFPPTGSTTVLGATNLDALIPELWSDQIIAAYKPNLVLGSLVTVFEHNGRKGDTIHIPQLTRATAASKAEATAVTITGNVETTIDISINKHFHVARHHEDFAAIQATDVMTWMTDDAGLALATQVDTHLHQLGTGLQSGTFDNSAPYSYTAGVIGGDGTTTWDPSSSGNGTALTDAGIRRAIQTLDDQNIPQMDRNLIIPPVEKRKLMGLARFTEQAFVGEVGAGNTIRNGRIGDIYGVGVYVSTNCIGGAGQLEAVDSTAYRACLLIHRSAFCLVMQQNVRVQFQYTLEWLATLMVADVVYGVGELRNLAGLALIVPAT